MSIRGGATTVLFSVCGRYILPSSPLTRIFRRRACASPRFEQEQTSKYFFWARGQAWGVYGSAIGYTYTHDEKFLDVFRKALAFYLSRLPEDMIPCWDMLFAPESGEPRDSSSAAIVACGLLEAAKYVDETEAAQWRTLARQMLASLAANYAVKPGTLGSGQLLHGTYSKKSPYNTCTPEGVDECTSWGDYFYMEALTRLTKDWEMYW